MIDEGFDEGGVRLICRQCCPKPDPAFREKALDWFIGKLVQKSFPATHPTTGIETLEHMWVRVTGVTRDALRGRLDNDPLLDVGRLRYGSKVVVRREEINAVEEAPNESDADLH